MIGHHIRKSKIKKGHRFQKSVWNKWASLWLSSHFLLSHEYWAACGYMTQSVTSLMLTQWNQSWHRVCRLMPSYVSLSHVTGFHLSASVPEWRPITYWGASCDTAKRRRVMDWNGKHGVWLYTELTVAFQIYKDIYKNTTRTCTPSLHGNMSL